MKRSNKSRRAFTLAELTVVLAVVAVLSVMVASFATLVRQNTRKSTEQLDALNEIEIVETLVENWLEENPNAEISFGTEETKGLFLDGNKKLEFDKITNVIPKTVENGQDVLYIYTIEYEISGTTNTYTFCVNTYTGEEVQQ